MPNQFNAAGSRCQAWFTYRVLDSSIRQALASLSALNTGALGEGEMRNRLARYAPGRLLTPKVDREGGGLSPSNGKSDIDLTLMSIHVYA
jgi:hypothetical protein